MSSTDPFRMIGKTLAGHFLVQSLVGEGRFSIVYRGLHIGPKKAVALKCYKLGNWLDGTTAETFLRRFREESKPSSQVVKEQPQFARGIGSGMTTSDEGLYIPYTVLEWLEGRSLARDLAERHQRGEAQQPLTAIMQRIGPAVKVALAHAHAQKIVHGDLNPGSFFLVGADGVKLLDLGVAKVMRDLSREIVPRAGGAPKGGLDKIFSPAYAAPEQLDPSLGDWGPQTDVYALALVLLEAMRGRPVSQAADAEDAAKVTLDAKNRPTPRALGLSVFDAVEAVFAKALAVHPGERWPGAREFWSGLEDAVRLEAPTRRVLVDDFVGDDEEPRESSEPSTEPRPQVASGPVGSGPATSPTVRTAAKTDKPTTDDTSPNGALVDMAIASHVANAQPSIIAPPAAVFPAERMSPVPKAPAAPVPPAAQEGGRISAVPPVPVQGRGPSALKPMVGGPTAPASGSGGLFKIPSPMPAGEKAAAKSTSTSVTLPSPTAPSNATPRTMPVAPAAPSSPEGGRLTPAPAPAEGRLAAPPVLAPPVIASGSVQPPPRPISPTVRGFPAPLRPRSEVPPPVPVAKPAPVVTAPATMPAPPPTPALQESGRLASQGEVLKTPRPKPAPIEIRRDTPTMPIEPVAAAETKPAEPEAPRQVREMVPPPRDNVVVGGLPSVIVDDPEQRKEKASRQRETVRVAMPPPSGPGSGAPTSGAPVSPPTPAVPWETAAANSALVAAANDDASDLLYPSRPVKKKRGLVAVALVSFLIVFLFGVVAIFVWRMSSEL